MPYLTEDQPGIGGRIKVDPEDFFVEEIPLYLPCGEGQHVYFEIEKRGLSTNAAKRKIARALNISPHIIGYAGLKDAQAVTRQTLSIEGIDTDVVNNLNLLNIKLLKVNRHQNKLKVGHLAGNRFIIRVRDAARDSLPAAQSIMDRLTQAGVPNFYGSQRFGNRANTHRLGEILIRGNVKEFVAEYLGRPQPQEAIVAQAARHLVDEGCWEEALAQWPGALSDEKRVLTAIVRAGGQIDNAFRALDKKTKSFFVSAFQSHLFNQLLTNRLDTLGTLQTGDVAYIHQKGASFIVEDAQVEQPRADRFEISPSGPLFGPKVLLAEGKPGQQERAILAEKRLSKEDFKVPGLKIRGDRRPYRFMVKNPKIWWDNGVVASFELPPGAYATTVMGEIMKN